MAHQQPISAQRLARWVGRRAQVLIDAVDEHEGLLIGRTCGDAPDIDGIVRIRPDPHSRHPVPVGIGRFASVDIVSSDDYDLEAVIVAT
jgi:ribosomal protein S12 methylthiotransferase